MFFSLICVLYFSWPARMCGPAIVMVHACLSVCRMQISPKLSKIDVWLLGNSNRSPSFLIQNLLSRFTIGSTFLSFRVFPGWHFAIHIEMGSWPSESISGSSHQSRHSTSTACFVMYITCIVICTASLKEKENTTTLGNMAGQLSSRPITDNTRVSFSATVHFTVSGAID